MFAILISNNDDPFLDFFGFKRLMQKTLSITTFLFLLMPCMVPSKYNVLGQHVWIQASTNTNNTVDHQSAQADDRQSAKLVQEIKDLIAGLGADDHQARSQSEAALLKIGEPAIAPLQAVLNFEDPEIVPDNEIRLRATRLLILIQSEVRERNLTEFLDGKRDDIDFDGWNEFQELVGNQSTARRLFVKLHRSRASLFEAPKLGKSKTENLLHKTISGRIRLSSSGNAESLIGNLGTVLFAASLKTKWAPDQLASAPAVPISDTKKIHKVLVKPHMVSTLKTHYAKAEFKDLISAWLQTFPFQSDESGKYAAIAIEVIEVYQLGEKSELLLRFANQKELPTHVRSLAIRALSQTADAKLTPKLLPLLGEQTVVGNYLLGRYVTKGDTNTDANLLIDVQIRDLALATLIILNESSLEDFGFFPQAFQENKLVINQAGFATREQRNEAFAKWKKRKASN